MVESGVKGCAAKSIMFYKLIFQDRDKRKKIDGPTSTFEGLLAYAQRAFKFGDQDVGFLFLGQDDVSAYEISCDEDLEYVLEATKESSSGSKFVTIKVIENFETSPENPDKFSRVDASEEEQRASDSFDNLSSAISKSQVPEEKEDLRQDLAQFDREVLRKSDDEAEEQKEMIESIDRMIEQNEGLAEFGKDLINEDAPDMEALNEEMQRVELEEEAKAAEAAEENRQDDEKPEAEENRHEEEKGDEKPEAEEVPAPVENPVLVEEPAKPEGMNSVLDEENIRSLASHLSESMLVETGADKKAELESKIGDILNATLSQINKKFENKQKKAEQRKKKHMTKKYFQFCGKVKKKMWKFNKKMKKLHSEIEDNGDVPFDTLIWAGQKEGFDSMEAENLKQELQSLAEVNRLQAHELESLQHRCRESEEIIATLQQGKPVDPSLLAKRASVSVETQHLNIVCDGCQTGNFKGRRFKCIICPDFDLCEDCEGKKVHSHPMLRLTVNNVDNRKLNWALRFMRNRPRFQRLFNLPVENSDSSDNDDKRKCRRRRWWWMKKMFGGKKGWKRRCRKRNASTSSSSSSGESNSPEKKHRGPPGPHPHGPPHGHPHGHPHGPPHWARGPFGPHRRRRHRRHHHGRRWKNFAQKMHKKGMKLMNKMGIEKPEQIFKPWFIDFSKQNEMNGELKNCARPFPGFMCGDFTKKPAPPVSEEKKADVKKEVVKKLENKTAEELVPEKVKKALEGMGVEIVDCYVEPKGEAKVVPEIGPNDIKVEIDIAPPVEQPKADLMSEDKLVRNKGARKTRRKRGRKQQENACEAEKEILEEKKEEDFKIECETPIRAKSSEEVEIDQRKEYVRVMLGEKTINEEILHFFVVNNLDLNQEDFYRLMEEQKKFLSSC